MSLKNRIAEIDERRAAETVRANTPLTYWETRDWTRRILRLGSSEADVKAVLAELSRSSSLHHKQVVDAAEEELAGRVSSGLSLTSVFNELVATADEFYTDMAWRLDKLRRHRPTHDERYQRQQESADRIQRAEKYLSETQSIARVVLHIWETKGAAAHPLIKAIARNISALSESDYNDLLKLDAAISAAIGKNMPEEKGSVPHWATPQRNARLAC